MGAVIINDWKADVKIIKIYNTNASKVLSEP